LFFIGLRSNFSLNLLMNQQTLLLFGRLIKAEQ
jgi:hypothetical protein